MLVAGTQRIQIDNTIILNLLLYWIIIRLKVMHKYALILFRKVQFSSYQGFKNLITRPSGCSNAFLNLFTEH